MQVNLLFAKCRLPPKKGTTLPRLERLGTLIGVRCLNFVQKELRLPIHTRILWTDSQCVLHWLVSKKLSNAFVENHLKEIRAQSNLNYRYIASSDNPTDQNAKQSKTDSMERITETNYKAQERTPRQAAIHAKRKIKTMFKDNVGVTLFS